MRLVFEKNQEKICLRTLMRLIKFKLNQIVYLDFRTVPNQQWLPVCAGMADKISAYI
ncbi:hypothetical protein [Legionella cardiaca]|uniref:Uncharacterized protein n=1 Tax=Legionella cardiaca TaxID=1071983 RepID=A0ABY8AN02_9GAMM|nr:hypothetical protein [Legionella cardiaca]WED41834.1 hypothetical protein PXX05_07770 [Legionella cardiaca]